MARYDSIYEYLTDKSTVMTELEKLDQCIAALREASYKMCGNADVKELQFNDGQTIVKSIFRDFSDMDNAMKFLEKQKHTILYGATGRTKRLITPNRARI